MDDWAAEEAAVAQHYDETIFDAEAERLTRDCPVEYAITARYLLRYIPIDAVVVEVGVGVGHYSELLARRGCRLCLVDVAERLLAAATARLRAAGFESQLIGAHRASATAMPQVTDASCTAALLLGPLYHLRSADARQQAVHEMARVLQPGGLVFAAAINRLAYLRDTFRMTPGQGMPWRDFHRQFLLDGNLDPAHAPPLGFGHLSTVDELRGLMAPTFDAVALVGVESFTTVWQRTLHDLAPPDTAAWLDLVEQTGATPEGLATSDHFLYIGRRR